MLKKLVTFPLLVVASFYIFIVEEFIWNPATAFLKWARKSFLVCYAEDWISKQKGYWAIIALFIIPGIPIWPIKLLALYLLGHEHVYFGISLFIAVKIVATALFAQLYTLVGQECEKVSWFHCLAGWVRWVRNKVQSHPTYQEAHAILVALKTKIKTRKSALRQRFIAIIKYTRKQKESE